MLVGEAKLRSGRKPAHHETMDSTKPTFESCRGARPEAKQSRTHSSSTASVTSPSSWFGTCGSRVEHNVIKKPNWTHTHTHAQFLLLAIACMKMDAHAQLYGSSPRKTGEQKPLSQHSAPSHWKKATGKTSHLLLRTCGLHVGLITCSGCRGWGWSLNWSAH